MESRLSEFTLNDLKNERDRLNSELSKSEEKLNYFYSDIYNNIPDVCYKYHDLYSKISTIETNLFCLNSACSEPFLSGIQARDLHDHSIFNNRSDYIFNRILTVNLHVHIFNKRYHEAALIILASDYILSSPILINKFIKNFNIDLINNFKNKLLNKISNEIIINHNIDEIRKILSSYLILTNKSINEILNFYLDSKNEYFKKFLAGKYTDSIQKNVISIIETFISTVKNSCFFIQNHEINSIYNKTFDFKNELEFDDKFLIFKRLITGFNEYCDNIKSNLVKIDQPILESTMKNWIEESKSVIELAVSKAINDVNSFFSLCQAFSFIGEIKDQISQFPFLFPILRHNFTQRSKILLEKEIETLFFKFDAIIPDFIDNDSIKNDSWSYENYEKFIKPFFQQFDVYTSFEKSCNFKNSYVLSEVHNFIINIYEHIYKLDELSINHHEILQAFLSILDSFYEKYSKKWCLFAKELLKPDSKSEIKNLSNELSIDITNKIIKVSEFSQFVKTSFELSISQASKKGYKINQNNFNPIKVWFKILSREFIKNYICLFDTYQQNFKTTFVNITLERVETNEEFYFKVPGMISHELLDLFSNMLHKINSSINTSEYSKSVLNSISTYINKHLWKDLIKTIESHIDDLNSDQIMQILFDVKFLYIILIQNKVTGSFNNTIFELLVQKMDDSKPLIHKAIESSMRIYLFRKMFMFRSIMSDTAIITIGEFKIQSKNEKNIQVKADQSSSWDQSWIESNIINEHLEYF